MMIEQTLDKLRALRLSGMVEAYRQQTENPDVSSLSFEERLGLMVDQHWTWRENKALARRLKTSRLETEPCVEDINYRYARQLDGAKLRSLLSCEWVTQHLAVIFTGPTGIGKSWLSRELGEARVDGSLGKLLPSLARVDVLVVDDFAMNPLEEHERRLFLEICDDRYRRRSTVLSSQLPVASWHKQIGDPTIADSILDRLVHSAYRFELDGESIRKKQGGRS
jgi:DNA replication protein DnaC